MRFIISCLVAIACLISTLDVRAASVALRPQALVPANISAKSDSLGFAWDISQQGSIDDGTNDCFDGALVLQINGQQFSPQQPMMTPDGSQLVLTGMAGAMKVTRYIKVDAANALVRYVDSVTNPTNKTQTVAFLLYSNMGGGPNPYVTDQGTPLSPSGALGKKESALIAFENPSNGRPTVVFFLCGVRSKMKPTIAASNGNDDIRVTYSLTIRPGKTVSILHTAAQRNFQAVPDAKTMATFLKPIRSRKFMSDLPASVRRTIVNGAGSYYGGYGGGPVDFSMAASVGIEPESADVLAYGDETRLRGSAVCDELSIKNRYGKQNLELADIAAIVGHRRLGKVSRVYLRDGQVISGELEVRGLSFTENTGVEIELSLDGLDRLVLHRSPEDGKPAAGAQAYVATYQGDRLAVAYPENVVLGLATPWGPVRVPLDDVDWFQPPDGGQPGHQVQLKDGSSVFAYLEGTPLAIRTLLFGNQSLQQTDIRGLRSASAMKASPNRNTSITRPHVVLSGGHILVGQVDLPVFRLSTNGEQIEIVPSQVRVLRNISEEFEDELITHRRAIFGAELWGGSVVMGVLEDDLLPIRLGDQLCQVPSADIAEIHVPTPTISDTLRARIHAAIRDLGHADWKKRERAGQELMGIGYMAKSLLQEAIAQTSDPEVRRRCESILAEIDE